MRRQHGLPRLGREVKGTSSEEAQVVIVNQYSKVEVKVAANTIDSMSSTAVKDIGCI
jgi:hypothetical protein